MSTTIKPFQPYRFKHYRELRDCGYTYEMFRRAHDFFNARNILIGWSRRRKEWYFAGVRGEKDTTHCKTLWCGTGAFIDNLDAPSEVLAGFKESEQPRYAEGFEQGKTVASYHATNQALQRAMETIPFIERKKYRQVINPAKNGYQWIIVEK